MKMGKKRSSEDSAESNTPVKTETVPEFNGTVLKAMLKDPTTAMKGEWICTVCYFYISEKWYLVVVLIYPFIHLSIHFSAGSICAPSIQPTGSVFALVNSYCLSPAGLETFIATAKKLPCSDLYDVVEGYIKISMECAEIFKLLERERHTESEVSWSTFLSGWGWLATCFFYQVSF